MRQVSIEGTANPNTNTPLFEPAFVEQLQPVDEHPAVAERHEHVCVRLTQLDLEVRLTSDEMGQQILLRTGRVLECWVLPRCLRYLV